MWGNQSSQITESGIICGSFQILFRAFFPNQLCVAYGIIVDEVIQLRSLIYVVRKGFFNRIAVNQDEITVFRPGLDKARIHIVFGENDVIHAIFLLFVVVIVSFRSFRDFITNLRLQIKAVCSVGWLGNGRTALFQAMSSRSNTPSDQIQEIRTPCRPASGSDFSCMVERTGFEPVTLSLPAIRAPNCANAPSQHYYSTRKRLHNGSLNFLILLFPEPGFWSSDHRQRLVRNTGSRQGMCSRSLQPISHDVRQSTRMACRQALPEPF